jgi:hypothetical protein
MKTLVVRQVATKVETLTRDLILEVPNGHPHAQWRLESLISVGALDYGPFSFRPISGSEKIEIADTVVVGETSFAADIPYHPNSPYGVLYGEFQGEFEP